MKTIYLLFDSLNRSALSLYGGEITTPNFERLAKRSTIMDQHYIGSMPCMPARRDMHTGRLNFFHRSWGPLEPFDDSFVVNMRNDGIYTHLTSDHNHYFEDGGATYHNRYNTYDFIRGQESDAWVAMVKPPLEKFREKYHPKQFGAERAPMRIQGMINETVFKNEKDYPLHKCFDAALNFLESNYKEESWFLHLECFDPHEPFAAPERFRSASDFDFSGQEYTWPQYQKSSEDTEEDIAKVRANYMALVRFCDEQLGRLLDFLDKNSMWEETTIILTTDHGFMLGEQDWWGKLRMPFFNEIAHIPLIIHDPNTPGSWGKRISKLTQTTDISATMLDLYELPPCGHSTGKSILPLIRSTADSIRKVAVYGVFGGAINATDGEFTYFLYPQNNKENQLYEYTLMPMHSTSLFEIRELKNAELVRGFNFTKGSPLLKIPALDDARRPPMQGGGFADTNTRLYDLRKDPKQLKPFRNPAVEMRLIKSIVNELELHEAPKEIYDIYGLND